MLAEKMVLENILAVFENKEKWTTEAYARNITGKHINLIDADDTCKFCLIGLMLKLLPFSIHSNNLALRDKIEEKLKQTRTYQHYGFRNLEIFNDAVGYDTVMNTIREAIELCSVA